MTRRARLTKDGILLSGGGFQTAVVAGVYGPEGDLPFSEDDAQSIATKYGFPAECDMYRQMTIWHETMKKVDRTIEDVAHSSERLQQYKAVFTAADRIISALQGLDHSAETSIAHRMMSEVMKDMEAANVDEGSYLKIPDLIYQIDIVRRAAKFRHDNLKESSQNTERIRKPDHPGFMYVNEHMIAPQWRKYQTYAFHGDFEEFDIEPKNECSKFVVEISNLIRADVPKTYIRTVMKLAQRNFNSRKPRPA